MTVTAHFDGRVFVPDGPVDLPVGQRVRIVEEPSDTPPVTDPFLAVAGLFQSTVPDAAERHDHYLGEAVADKLRGEARS
jgi:hypothetical protein